MWTAEATTATAKSILSIITAANFDLMREQLCCNIFDTLMTYYTMAILHYFTSYFPFICQWSYVNITTQKLSIFKVFCSSKLKCQVPIFTDFQSVP